MTDSNFDRELEALGTELRRQRGACPPTDTLQRFAGGELGAEAAEEVGLHLRLCVECRELVEAVQDSPAAVDEVSWRRVERRLAQRPAPWRRARPGRVWWSAAAVVVAVLGIALWSLGERSAELEGEVTRGTALKALEPIGEVSNASVFRWQGPPLEVGYRVELKQGDVEIWTGASAEREIAAPADLLRRLAPGVTYRWRVVGVADSGRTVAESDWVELVLRESTD
ncbi:MAG: hypothetical protein R3190_10475 [Thermoanaerobaculia bacterium]|nr:hypothetical protein [Thermoanaerobaculia bacterium]